MILTVANAKGGVGKTTTAVFLAHALTRSTGALCAVVDADPQASAWQWSRETAQRGRPLDVPVIAQPTARLSAPAAPHVVIDTPPGDRDIVEAAVDLADLVVVPTSPSSLDLSRVRVTLDAAAAARTPVVVLLTRTRRTRSVADALAELAGIGATVLGTHIALRESLAMAFGHQVGQLHGYDLAAAELSGALPADAFPVDAVRRRVARGWDALPPLVPPRPALVGPALVGPGAAPAPVRTDPLGLNQDAIARLKDSVARLAAQR